MTTPTHAAAPVDDLVLRAGFTVAHPTNSDAHDFHEIAVWTMVELLTLAYERGQADAKKERS